MKKLSLAIVVGTRPEIIRLSRVIAAADAYFDLTLVHTGQNYDYELNEIFFQDMEIRSPDVFLNAAGKTAAETIGNTIAKFDQFLETKSFDAMLVLGDTNSCLSALSAKRRKIPVFHMEAGNRCFDQRVPEEINRKIVDHISDINLTYSDISREYLLREGLPPDRVIKTGSPMYEVLHHYLPKIEKSDVLERLGVTVGDYFVVSAHREENVDNPSNFRNLIDALNRVATTYEKRIIFSAHPRTRKKLDANEVQFHPLVELMKPVGFSDFVKLQKSAFVVLSDSGTISEESSILNFRAVNIRQAHERPEAMEEASVIMAGVSPDRIFQAVSVIANQHVGSERLLRPVGDYSMPNVSEKVVRIVLSYTDYVNRVVWSKPL
ncbi:MAG: UDP-N-acetylglucosamine 2-epimerase (non-hydrolyzing) [Planctomycetota bacterium]|nr:UDP-N-acetylglucosamine 2-epimerase (non-hydrolyzing) [Planctomycetota bacterium]